MSTDRIGFGIFVAPFHPPPQNPTLALERDLEIVEYADKLGFDEAWIGEHHSGGHELICSPEVFMAAAAERTKRIRLGPGVISLPYHNPLWATERIVLLDHLTRGRVMMGVGPGALPTDGKMIGLTPDQNRPALERALDAVMQLLRSEEPVSVEAERFVLNEARLHLRPYSNFDVAVASVASPVGAQLAGKYGIGLLSLSATSPAGFDALARQWGIAEEAAAESGATVDRSKWRLVGPMHLADTKEQAIEDVRYGMEVWFRYFQHVAAFPQMAVPGDNLDEMINFINGEGVGVIGTVDMAINQVKRLAEQSGGFGHYLLMAHDWARPAATKRSLELFAQFVMPEFQGQSAPLVAAQERARAVRTELADQQQKAVDELTAQYDAKHGNKA